MSAGSTNQVNSAFHPFWVGKWVVIHGLRRWRLFKLQIRATCSCIWQHRSKSVCADLACCHLGWMSVLCLRTAPLKAVCANTVSYKWILPSPFHHFWRCSFFSLISSWNFNLVLLIYLVVLETAKTILGLRWTFQKRSFAGWHTNYTAGWQRLHLSVWQGFRTSQVCFAPAWYLRRADVAVDLRKSCIIISQMTIYWSYTTLNSFALYMLLLFSIANPVVAYALFSAG